MAYFLLICLANALLCISVNAPWKEWYENCSWQAVNAIWFVFTSIISVVGVVCFIAYIAQVIGVP